MTNDPRLSDIGVVDVPTILVFAHRKGATEYGGWDYGIKISAVILVPATSRLCRNRLDGHGELLDIVRASA